ncbi:hypothetical protein PBI_ALSFRO_6 [Mycobacterium phage Alsfro]|uniref:hypothetical protein n=1 Tax=Mycobacterium phage Alsfro TaxID=1458724 RepID=UPI00042E303A|nr:hypothetical protein PBI_ALSFRO_6 [Mycobacterium phage Alsfro]AHK12057.1 hypothetical protein PBI_ALSFRO_6 [Mycobacterium phage Alsfro]
MGVRFDFRARERGRNGLRFRCQKGVPAAITAGFKLDRQARPASNQERSPLAGMSSTGKRAPSL